MTTSTTTPSSRISGFHKLDVPARIDAVARFAGLDEADKAHLLNTGNLPLELASHLIENFIGTMNIPIGIATNMRINGRDRLIPMATEESSVVAAVCNAARQCYDQGGFITSMSGTEMIAQIQLTHVRDPQNARISILERKEEIRALCDACDPVLVKFGGGFQDLEVRVLETRGGPMVNTVFFFSAVGKDFDDDRGIERGLHFALVLPKYLFATNDDQIRVKNFVAIWYIDHSISSIAFARFCF